MASLLAQTRGVPTNERLSDNSLANSHPELTIEPIYRSTTAESRVGADSEFDQSHNGRRVSTYIDSEGRLQVKNSSESPETRNLSERDSEEGQGSDSEADFHEDGISQLSSKDPSNTSMFASLTFTFAAGSNMSHYARFLHSQLSLISDTGQLCININQCSG